MIKQVGQFTVEVWEPYPCRVIIRQNDRKDQELIFNHNDIRDLEYAVQAAIREVNEKLGKAHDKPI